MDPDLAAALSAIQGSLTTIVSTLESLVIQVSAFDQLLVYLLYAGGRGRNLPEPPWWQDLLQQFNLDLEW